MFLVMMLDKCESEKLLLSVSKGLLLKLHCANVRHLKVRSTAALVRFPSLY